jgi:hypothetical protein
VPISTSVSAVPTRSSFFISVSIVAQRGFRCIDEARKNATTACKDADERRPISRHNMS